MNPVKVKIFLKGGAHYTFNMTPDSPLLKTLFETLVSRTHPLNQGSHQWLQIPLDQGSQMLSFNREELMAIVTQPPLAVQKVDEFILDDTCFFYPEDF